MLIEFLIENFFCLRRRRRRSRRCAWKKIVWEVTENDARRQQIFIVFVKTYDVVMFTTASHTFKPTVHYVAWVKLQRFKISFKSLFSTLNLSRKFSGKYSIEKSIFHVVIFPSTWKFSMLAQTTETIEQRTKPYTFHLALCRMSCAKMKILRRCSVLLLTYFDFFPFSTEIQLYWIKHGSNLFVEEKTHSGNQPSYKPAKEREKLLCVRNFLAKSHRKNWSLVLIIFH